MVPISKLMWCMVIGKGDCSKVSVDMSSTKKDLYSDVLEWKRRSKLYYGKIGSPYLYALNFKAIVNYPVTLC